MICAPLHTVQKPKNAFIDPNQCLAALISLEEPICRFPDPIPSPYRRHHFKRQRHYLRTFRCVQMQDMGFRCHPHLDLLGRLL